MTAAIALAPIVETRHAPRIIHGGRATTRPECWAAETTDGIWQFDREESAGTPWLVYHKPSVADRSLTMPVLQCGTLRACRAMVASGAADQELALRKADPDMIRLAALLAAQI